MISIDLDGLRKKFVKAADTNLLEHSDLPKAPAFGWNLFLYQNQSVTIDQNRVLAPTIKKIGGGTNRPLRLANRCQNEDLDGFR